MNKKHKEAASPTEAKASAAEPAPRRPVKWFRIEDVSCSVWSRQSKAEPVRTFYGCTFERSYKDKNGETRYTGSFDLDSLGKVVELCRQASDWITEAQSMEASDPDPERKGH